MSEREAIAIIPARGGSKRLPRKNVLPFRGKPMIVWTIEAALSCREFDRVVVSTDDAEIASSAQAAGAEVLLRPDRLADDTTPLVEVLLHALDAIRADASRFAMLQPNCPLRPGSEIAAAKRTLIEAGAPAVLSVVAFGWTPPFRALREDESGLEFMFGRQYQTKSQDYPDCVCPTGAVFWADRGAFLRARALYQRGLKAHRMPWHLGIDIDTREDFVLAEAIAFCIDRGFSFDHG
jgi:N-acylneuraminate cytidylyltransferase